MNNLLSPQFLLRGARELFTIIANGLLRELKCIIKITRRARMLFSLQFCGSLRRKTDKTHRVSRHEIAEANAAQWDEAEVTSVHVAPVLPRFEQRSAQQNVSKPTMRRSTWGLRDEAGAWDLPNHNRDADGDGNSNGLRIWLDLHLDLRVGRVRRHTSVAFARSALALIPGSSAIEERRKKRKEINFSLEGCFGGSFCCRFMDEQHYKS